MIRIVDSDPKNGVVVVVASACFRHQIGAS
jgi:hypothetical protein